MEGNTIQINVGITINSCAHEKYLSSIRDDLAIMCNEFIESYD